MLPIIITKKNSFVINFRLIFPIYVVIVCNLIETVFPGDQSLQG